MAEIDLDPTKISEAVAEIEKLKEIGLSTEEAIRKLKETGSVAGNVLDKAFSVITEKAKNASEQLKNFASGMEAFRDPMKYFQKMGVDIEAIKSTLGGALGGTDNLAISLGGVAAAGAGLTFVSNEFEQIGRSAADSTFHIGNVKDMINKVSNNPLFKGMDIGKFGLMVNWGKTAEQAKDLENALLRNAAAAGTLNDMINTTGDTFGNMDSKLLKFSRLTQNIGNATGLSAGKVAEYYTELQKIPGALDKEITLNEQLDSNLHMLDATIRVARGTMREFKDVAADLTLIYSKMGITGQEALQVISRMTEASNKLQIPFSNIKGLITKTSNDFEMFGKAAGSVNNNLQGAIDVMGKLGPALKTYGLGPEAIETLVGRFTSGISNLQMAQKAFLSAQTGGAGGLKGAFEIDLMLREGNLDQVFDKVQQSMMKQFGGRIVTLEQAARSEEAAAQMAKQVQILTSGPLKVAQTETEAYAIISAMAKGEKPADIAGAQKSLENTVKRGDEIRNRQYTALTRINNQLEFIGNLQAVSTYALTRKTIGTEGFEPFADAALKSMKESAALAVASKEEGETDVDKEAGRLKDTVMEDISIVQESFSRFFIKAKDKLAGKGETKKETEGKGEAVTPPARKKEEVKTEKLPSEYIREVTPGKTLSEQIKAAAPEKGPTASLKPESKETKSFTKEVNKLMTVPTTPGQVVGTTLATPPPEKEYKETAATMPEKQSYVVDVVCTNCSKKQFSQQVDGLNLRVKTLERNTSYTGAVSSA